MLPETQTDLGLSAEGLQWIVNGYTLAFGMAFTFVPLTLLATSNVTAARAGLASGLFDTTQQVAFFVGAAMIAVAVVVALLRIHDADVELAGPEATAAEPGAAGVPATAEEWRGAT